MTGLGVPSQEVRRSSSRSVIDETHHGHFFIGGRWQSPASSERIQVVSPASEEIIASVPEAVEADVDSAVAAAREALTRGTWSRCSLDDRLAMLRRLSDQFARRREEIATTITAEMGCPITLSRSMQAGSPKMFIDSAVDVAATYPWQELRSSDTGTGLVVRRPVGVVAAIVPWNAPLSAAMVKIAPALAAGCTIVLKPAPETPLSAYLLAEMLEAAGFPAGVVNIVAAERRVSEYLVAHRGVNKVAFTGSSVTGRRVAELCANDFRRVTLELGGKSAALVLDDADLGTVGESLRLGSFRNSGQVCSLKTRIVVSRRRHDEVLDRLIGLVKSMQVGDPTDEGTEIGPLVSSRQRGRVEGYIDSGRQEGAIVACGGGRPAHLSRGWYVEPTVFTGATREMQIAREEIFGPVLTVITAKNEDDAVDIANSSTYGLNGAVFSADPMHALAVARRIDTGTVEINGAGAGRFAPMGGWKSSGIGREVGPEGIDAFVEVSSYGIPPGAVPGVAAALNGS